jgi:hypothetical protein
MIVNIDLSGEPLIYIKYEHFSLSVPFKHSLHYCVPSAFNTDAYRINKHSWWILCDSLYDSASEIRCIYDKTGICLSYHRGTTQCKYYLSEHDAQALIQNIERAIHSAGFVFVKKEPVRILKPTNSPTEYRVYPSEYKVNRTSTLLDHRIVASLSVPTVKRSTTLTVHL